MAAYRYGPNDPALVNSVDTHVIRAEVADVEQRVVRRNQPAHRTVPNQVTATDFVGVRLYDGEAVRLEIADEDLAAIRLQRHVDRHFPRVEQRQHAIRPKVDGRQLVRSRACHIQLAAVRQDHHVLRLCAHRYPAADRQLAGVDE